MYWSPFDGASFRKEGREKSRQGISRGHREDGHYESLIMGLIKDVYHAFALGIFISSVKLRYIGLLVLNFNESIDFHLFTKDCI